MNSLGITQETFKAHRNDTPRDSLKRLSKVLSVSLQKLEKYTQNGGVFKRRVFLVC